jgi:hypothetical protein
MKTSEGRKEGRGKADVHFLSLFPDINPSRREK